MNPLVCIDQVSNVEDILEVSGSVVISNNNTVEWKLYFGDEKEILGCRGLDNINSDIKDAVCYSVTDYLKLIY